MLHWHTGMPHCRQLELVASSAAELGLGSQQRTLHAVSAECVRRAPLLLVGPAVFRCARVRPQRPGACLQPLHHGLHPHMLNHLSLLGGIFLDDAA